MFGALLIGFLSGITVPGSACATVPLRCPGLNCYDARIACLAEEAKHKLNPDANNKKPKHASLRHAPVKPSQRYKKRKH